MREFRTHCRTDQGKPWAGPKPGLRKVVLSALVMLLPMPSQVLLTKGQSAKRVLPWSAGQPSPQGSPVVGSMLSVPSTCIIRELVGLSYKEK